MSLRDTLNHEKARDGPATRNFPNQSHDQYDNRVTGL